jgi:beta-fructofuranosidase
VTEPFAPAGWFLWDLWLLQHAGRYHLFHLQAPREPGGAATRGDRASIGHASSADLVHWEPHGLALAAGPPGAWDDLALWTGSVVAHNSRFYMLYTGRRRAAPAIQQIGLAVSDDLFHWEKHAANPVCSADQRWYATLADGRYPTEDWRDPYILYAPEQHAYYALITARDRHQPPPYAGCVGLARSSDLLVWECLAPLASPGVYKEMECPQLVRRTEGCYLVFSTHDFNYAPGWARAIGGAQSGAHVFAADGLLDAYAPVGTGVLLGSASNCYGTRICQDPEGQDVALSWLFRTPREPDFAGRLDRPRKVRLSRTGLHVQDEG